MRCPGHPNCLNRGQSGGQPVFDVTSAAKKAHEGDVLPHPMGRQVALVADRRLGGLGCRANGDWWLNKDEYQSGPPELGRSYSDSSRPRRLRQHRQPKRTASRSLYRATKRCQSSLQRQPPITRMARVKSTFGPARLQKSALSGVTFCVILLYEESAPEAQP